MKTGLFKILALGLATLGLTACSPTMMVPPATAKTTPLLDICEGRQDETCQARLKFAKRIIDSTVSITSASYNRVSGAGMYGGTGFIIEGGYILTAWHVVDDSPIIYVNYRTLRADGQIDLSKRGELVHVIAYSPDRDVALLKLTDKSVSLPPPLKIRQKPIVIGEDVWQFGKTTVWSWGSVVKTDIDFGGTAGMILASTAVQPGDSGGPLVDTYGQVIGIALRVNPETRYGYFMPADTTLKVLPKDP